MRDKLKKNNEEGRESTSQKETGKEGITGANPQGHAKRRTAAKHKRTGSTPQIKGSKKKKKSPGGKGAKGVLS